MLSMSFKKSKRKCLLVINNLCSLCCGTTREKETCEKCVYYQEPNLTRRYKDVPAYTTQMMDDNSDLQSYANVIESTLCAFDQSTGNEIKDEAVIKISDRG